MTGIQYYGVVWSDTSAGAPAFWEQETVWVVLPEHLVPATVTEQVNWMNGSYALGQVMWESSFWTCEANHNKRPSWDFIRTNTTIAWTPIPRVSPCGLIDLGERLSTETPGEGETNRPVCFVLLLSLFGFLLWCFSLMVSRVSERAGVRHQLSALLGENNLVCGASLAIPF